MPEDVALADLAAEVVEVRAHRAGRDPELTPDLRLARTTRVVEEDLGLTRRRADALRQLAGRDQPQVLRRHLFGQRDDELVADRWRGTAIGDDETGAEALGAPSRLRIVTRGEQHDGGKCLPYPALCAA